MTKVIFAGVKYGLRGEKITLDEKNVIEVIAEGFINLDLPEQLRNLIEKILCKQLIGILEKELNKMENSLPPKNDE